MGMDVLPACVSVYQVCVWCSQGSEEGVRLLPQDKLLGTVQVPGIEPRTYGKAASVLNQLSLLDMLFRVLVIAVSIETLVS